MKILDVELDTSPTTEKVIEMAELRIRNLLCFKELQSFNDTGTWIDKHPLITHQSEYGRLEKLFLLNNKEFMEKYYDCSNNVKRYESYLRSDKRIDNRDTDRALLTKHTERKSVFESVISNHTL